MKVIIVNGDESLGISAALGYLGLGFIEYSESLQACAEELMKLERACFHHNLINECEPLFYWNDRQDNFKKVNYSLQSGRQNIKVLRKPRDRL